jgi:indolepyruvate ferredoxin oxidoreductase beta subunit
MGDVNSPLVPKRKGDVILSLEPTEALRYIEYVRKDGYVVSSSRKIRPTSVNQEGVIYPSLEKLKEVLFYFVENVYFLNSESLAKKAGSDLAENVVMLGALARIVDLPFEKGILKEVIHDFFPERYKRINMNAFELGYESAKE